MKMKYELDAQTVRSLSGQLGMVLVAMGIINYMLQDSPIPSDSAITLFTVGLSIITLSIRIRK